MSTAGLTYPSGPETEAPTTPTPVRSRAPLALACGLLLLTLYAAFEHGAVGSAPEARLQVTIAVLAAFAAAGLLWTGALRLTPRGRAGAGIGLLAGFAIWNGLSLIWSVSPDHTWAELNRALSYVIVLCLAVAVGASLERSVELVTTAFALVALVVTAYALGQKVLPGLHVSGVFDLNRTGPLPRLQEPLGYWNALALFVAMGVPCALALAADTARSARARLAAAAAMQLMLLVIGLTYSRGAVLALVVALVVGVGLSGARLRSLMWLALAVLATIPALLFGLLDHSLTTTGVSLGDREVAGVELGLVLAASVAGLVFAGRKLLDVEGQVRIGPERARAIARLLAMVAGVGVVVIVFAAALSSRGLTGTISHAWNSFIATRPANVTDPSRLLSADSANRWVWWKEAAGAFSDRPIAGWGAGSFGVVHLLYRRDTLGVQQPHSVPLQFLAETGIVGAALAIGAFVLLLRAAAATVRRRVPGTVRLLAAAALTAVVTYVFHSLYDWDWDIPAVTLPAIVLLGVLIGAADAQPHGSFAALGRAGRGLRAVALAAVTLWLCSFGLSAVLPSLAASKASAALVTAGSGKPGALQSALSSARLASDLDPLSDSGLRVQATVAIAGGQLQRARRYLLDALRRNPSDGQAWQSLAFVDVGLGDVRDGARAASRSLALDPQSLQARVIAMNFVQRANLLIAPPQDSATAVATPAQ
jgi:O-antigen ligase